MGTLWHLWFAKKQGEAEASLFVCLYQYNYSYDKTPSTYVFGGIQKNWNASLELTGKWCEHE